MLFFTPYIVAKMGVEAYGIATLAMQMIPYANVATAAVNALALRFIAVAFNANQPDAVQRYISTVFWANVAMAVAMALPAAWLVWQLGAVFNVPPHLLPDARRAFALVFLHIAVALVGGVFGAATFCKNKMHLRALRETEAHVLKLGLVVGLFALLQGRLYFIALAMVAMALYVTARHLRYTQRFLPWVTLSPRLFCWRALVRLLRGGAWESFNQLGFLMLNGLDMLVANLVLGATAGGVLALANTVPLAAAMFTASLVAAVTPQITLAYNVYTKKQPLCLKHTRLCMRIIGFFTAVPLAFALVYGDVFFALWQAGADSAELHRLLRLILLPLCLFGGVHTLRAVYVAANRLRLPALVTLGVGVAKTGALFVVLFAFQGTLGVIPLAGMWAAFVLEGVFHPVYGAKCLGLRGYSLFPTLGRNALCALVAVGIGGSVRWLLAATEMPYATWPRFFVLAAFCGATSAIAGVFIMFNREERAMGWAMWKTLS